MPSVAAPALPRFIRSVQTRCIAALALASWCVSLTIATTTQATTQRPNDLTTAEGVKAELDRLSSEADTWSIKPRTLITYEVITKSIVDEDTLNTWRREVEGKPFHPRRTQLEAAEQILRDGPRIRTVRFLWVDDSRWRNSADTPFLHESYRDTAQTQDGQWQLSPTKIFLAGHGAQFGNEVTANVKSASLSSIKMLMLAGAAEFPSLAKSAVDSKGELIGPAVRMTGSKWSADWTLRFDTESVWETTAHGRVAYANEIGGPSTVQVLLIERIEHRWQFPGETGSRRITNEGWEWSELTGGPIVREVNTREGTGATATRRIIDVETVDQRRADLLLKTPTLEGGDAFRDLSKIVAINIDGAAGHHITEVFRSESGEALNARNLAIPIDRGNTGTPTWQWVSWLLAGLLVTIVIVLRLRRGVAD